VTGTLNHWQLEIQYKTGICYHIFLHWGVSDVCWDHFCLDMVLKWAATMLVNKVT
jgi:hypothetical protein